MQKSHFLNSVDFALVVSVFVSLCNIFSNIIVKLHSSLMKRSVTFCIFSFCSRCTSVTGCSDVFYLSPLGNCFMKVSDKMFNLPLIRQAKLHHFVISTVCLWQLLRVWQHSVVLPAWFPVSAPNEGCLGTNLLCSALNLWGELFLHTAWCKTLPLKRQFQILCWVWNRQWFLGQSGDT